MGMVRQWWHWAAPRVMLVTALACFTADAEAASVVAGGSIQAAIDAAQPGETISLAPGQYAQGFTLRDGVRLVGAGVDSTIVTGTILIPGSVVSGVTIAGLTGNALTSAGSNVTIQDAAFTGTVYFEGAGSSQVTDTTFRWYVVGTGQAVVHHRRTTTRAAAFSWEQSRVTFEDSTFHEAADLSGSSQTTFLRSPMKSIFVSGDARATLDQVTSSSTLSARGRSRVSITGSQLGAVSWEENGNVSITDSQIGRASLTIASTVAADLIDIGPGLIADGSATSATGFGASIQNSRIDIVGLDVSGAIAMSGGGFNGYATMRSGSSGAFYDVITGELMRMLGDSQVELVGSTLGASVEVWEQSSLTLSGTASTAGTVFVKDNASLLMADGAVQGRVQLNGRGAARVEDATLSKLILYVDAGLSADIDGLAPGTTSGALVQPDPLGDGGPTLELNNGTLSSLQLWVHGEADIARTRVDDYAVAEGDAVARFTDSAFTFVALFRGDAEVACGNCAVSALTMSSAARASFTGGTLQGYNDLRESSVVTLAGATVKGLTEARGTSTLRFDGATSTGLIRLLSSSRGEVLGGSDINELRVEEKGAAVLADSRIRSLRLEVGAGYDLTAVGLHHGLLTTSFGPTNQGPRLDAANAQVDSAGVLNTGSLKVVDSTLNGYAWAWPGSSAVFERTVLEGTTVLQSGSTNRFTDSTVKKYLETNGSTNTFSGVRFDVGATISIVGSSNNSFTGCTFERGLTLEGSSQNNFGDLAGNPGENDFSAISTGYKLANRTPNAVKALNNLWGLDTAPEIADALLDGADGNTYGLIQFDPFKVRNRPPLVLAGDDRIIPSNAQELTQFLGSAIDPDGDALTYRWLEGGVELWPSTIVDVLSGEALLDLALVGYLEDGEHRLTLEVTEPSGRVVTDEVVLVVNNSAPVAMPSGAGSYAQGDPILLGGEVADYDGDVVTWTWWWGEEPLLTGTVSTVTEGAVVALPELALPVALPLGSHVLELELDDSVNQPVRRAIEVEVLDVVPPTLSPIAWPAILWPPNGKMRDVVVDTFAMDSSGGAVHLAATVSSNEQAGRKDPDWTTPEIDEATGEIRLKLRAERAERGLGRLYVIKVTATDEAGNKAVSRAFVFVPRWGFAK